MRALWLASALGGLAQSLAGTTGALLAQDVTGSDAAAGLPQSLLVAGAAVSALGMSTLTRHRGRRAALCCGALIAVAGCLVVTSAAAVQSLTLILVGSLLLGAGNTAVMLGRYAAADLGPEAVRVRAMASVLTATTIGAVAGPNLLAPTSILAAGLGVPPLSGPYLVAAISFGAAAGVLALGLRGHLPALTPSASAVPPGRPPGPSATRGLAVLVLSNLVMVSVMTMAPVQLHHVDAGLGVIGLVVSLHIAGMFAPSPLSGRFVTRVGAGPAAASAGVLLVAACLVAASGYHSLIVMGLGMVLLGIGWNLGLIAGSALLTADVPIAHRPTREGWGEVGMGTAAAGGGAVSGPIMVDGGYGLLAVAGAAAAALVLPVGWRGAFRGH